ncbi:hypothetical protein AX16_004898 [Volvariella volvacea WC 439]|nr:hypothetical protein AX16_004898 [Volvariella volvacea WC 439]
MAQHDAHVDPEMKLVRAHGNSGAGNTAAMGNSNAIDHSYKTAPVITGDAAERLGEGVIPQRAVYGGILSQVIDGEECESSIPKLYINTNAPFSAVICGLQGSGKSHSTSVLLESCLIKDERLGFLPQPLSAVVFHFDSAAGGNRVRPCEAAYLSTLDPELGEEARPPKVTVLVLPKTMKVMQEVYASLPNVEVKPLHFALADISGERLLSMMKVDDGNNMPLYMELIMTILRDMDEFDYSEFRERLKGHKLNGSQKAMLNIRLALLESCLKDGDATNSVSTHFSKGRLTIIDLSSPFMNSSSACSFFDIILGLYLEAELDTGKLVVLDEAHKYLGDGGGSEKLTESLLAVIRQERHLNTRVIISTQEPTVVPAKFLELSSFIVAHRFSSPQWLQHLYSHISISKTSQDELFSKIIGLQTGQALLFAPSGLGVSNKSTLMGTLSTWDNGRKDAEQLTPLGQGYLKVHSRQRITLDGGRSLLATAASAKVVYCDDTHEVDSGLKNSSDDPNDTHKSVVGNGWTPKPTPQTSVAQDWGRADDWGTPAGNLGATWSDHGTSSNDWKATAEDWGGGIAVKAANDWAAPPSTQVDTSSRVLDRSPFIPLLTVLARAKRESGTARLTWSMAASVIKDEFPNAFVGKFGRHVKAAEDAGLVTSSGSLVAHPWVESIVDTGND